MYDFILQNSKKDIFEESCGSNDSIISIVWTKNVFEHHEGE